MTREDWFPGTVGTHFAGLPLRTQGAKAWICRRCNQEMKPNGYGWFEHVDLHSTCECQHADYLDRDYE